MIFNFNLSQLIYQLESRKYEAVNCERFDNARKLKNAINEIETVGLSLGAMEMEKKMLVQALDYEGAKVKKVEMDTMREDAYRRLAVAELLEMPSPSTRRRVLEQKSHEDLPPVAATMAKPRSPSVSSFEEEVVEP